MSDTLKYWWLQNVGDRFWGLWYGFSTLWNKRRRDIVIATSMITDECATTSLGSGGTIVQLYLDAKGNYHGGIAKPAEDKPDAV